MRSTARTVRAKVNVKLWTKFQEIFHTKSKIKVISAKHSEVFETFHNFSIFISFFTQKFYYQCYISKAWLWESACTITQNKFNFHCRASLLLEWTQPRSRDISVLVQPTHSSFFKRISADVVKLTTYPYIVSLC